MVRLFNIFSLVSLLTLVGTLLVIEIPNIARYLDKGHDSCTIEEFLAGKELNSRNITITGNALFDRACRYEETISPGTLREASYYIPLVDSNWTEDQEVKVILVYGSKGPGFSSFRKKDIQKKESFFDSLSLHQNNRQSFEARIELYRLNQVDIRARNYFMREESLQVANILSLSVIPVNRIFWFEGMVVALIFMAGAISLMVFFLFREKKRKLASQEAFINRRSSTSANKRL